MHNPWLVHLVLQEDGSYMNFIAKFTSGFQLLLSAKMCLSYFLVKNYVISHVHANREGVLLLGHVFPDTFIAECGRAFAAARQRGHEFNFLVTAKHRTDGCLFGGGCLGRRGHVL